MVDEQMATKKQFVPTNLTDWVGNRDAYQEWKHSLFLQISSHRWKWYMKTTDEKLAEWKLSDEIQKGQHQKEFYLQVDEANEENKLLMVKIFLMKRTNMNH